MISYTQTIPVGLLHQFLSVSFTVFGYELLRIPKATSLMAAILTLSELWLCFELCSQEEPLMSPINHSQRIKCQMLFSETKTKTCTVDKIVE